MYLKKTSAQIIIWSTYLFLSIAACSSNDDAAAIGKLVTKGVDLAEKHDIGSLMDLTAKHFFAMPGNHNARAVKGILFQTFKYYEKFHILSPKPLISIDEKHINAAVTVYFVIVRQKHDLPGIGELYNDPKQWVETIGEKADLYQIKLEMTKQSGSWQVTQAHLKPFKGYGF